jgi:DNA-binding NtrC family response regulator
MRIVAMAGNGTQRCSSSGGSTSAWAAVPPLRRRKGDIPALAAHFIGKAYGKEVRGLAPGTLNALLAHDWPVNVRELENAVERAVLLCQTADLTADDLPPTLRGPCGPRSVATSLTVPRATRLSSKRLAPRLQLADFRLHLSARTCSARERHRSMVGERQWW